MFKQTTQAIAEFESVKQNKADSESATDTFLEDLGPNCDWVGSFACCFRYLRPGLSRDAANFTRLVLGCIEANFCK